MSEESKYSINSGFIGQFVMIDYMIFIITVLISAGIGAFYAILDRKRVNNTDYHLGGKNMSVFPVAMSLMVTFMSALTLLGNPAEIYNYNTMFMWIIVALSFAIFGATHIFIPFFFKLQVTSTIEVSYAPNFMDSELSIMSYKCLCEFPLFFYKLSFK